MPLRVPYRWLKDYVDVSVAPQELANRLTVGGMEVESVTEIGAGWERDKIFVGHILRIEPHPGADRLCLATVEYGAGRSLTVVTGAPNLLRYRSEPLPAEPLKAPLAVAGADLIDGHAADGRRMKLKPGTIRGVRSEGMVCSEKELGISEEHEGILLLPSDAPTGAPLADYLGDQVLEFDIKGGFAHLMCIYGIAREAAALLGLPLKPDIWRAGRAGNPAVTASPSFLRLEIADPRYCPRFTAVLVEGIAMRPAPFWMQQRLIRAGMRPINAVVDVTNYVMLEMGQPLHAFDYATLRPEQAGGAPMIRVRPARPGERMTTLDGVERVFDGQMALVTDGGGPVSIGGVMGGAQTEISAGTTAVLVEAANWDFLNIRRTSQVLKLRTEAGDRFGKRLSPEIALPAALRAATLIAELCGGTVRPEYADLYPLPFAPKPVTLPLDKVTRLLGVTVAREEAARILTALEFQVSGTDPLIVTPPGFRMDIGLPEDLVEEIGRVYGYDRMPSTRIRDELPPQRRNRELEGEERVRDLLAGCGLDEIIAYSIVPLDDEPKLHPERVPVNTADYLSVRNPLDAGRAHLRRRLLAGGLNTVRANLRFLQRIALFELGAVFHPQPDRALPREPKRLCALLTGPRAAPGWLTAGGEDSRFDFFDVKGVAEALLDGLQVADVTWERGSDASYHPGRCAQVSAGGAVLGHLGELHPRVVAAFDLPPQPVCALELDLDALIKAWREDRQMDPISTHPPIYEDLAFVVDETLPAERMREMIQQTGRPLLRGVTLFDLFQDDKIGPGKKSLAYALTYQADDRTLTDDEVAKVRAKIVKRLEKELGAVLRA
jgi:phenylalanyl-tRNA synthetase beta chain